jgi:hypothetical protein
MIGAPHESHGPSDFPKTPSEFADMAQLMAQRILVSGEVADCFAAIVAAAHLPDWYNRKPLKDREKEDLAKRYPAWETLRQLANGAKHARRTEGQRHPEDFVARPIEWGDTDAWDYLGSTKTAWLVEHEGQQRTVIALCRGFIAQYRQDKGF